MTSEFEKRLAKEITALTKQAIPGQVATDPNEDNIPGAEEARDLGGQDYAAKEYSLTTQTGFADEPHTTYELVLWENGQPDARQFEEDESKYKGTVFNWREGEGWDSHPYVSDDMNIYENDFYNDTDPADQFVTIDEVRAVNPQVAGEIEQIISTGMLPQGGYGHPTGAPAGMGDVDAGPDFVGPDPEVVGPSVLKDVEAAGYDFSVPLEKWLKSQPELFKQLKHRYGDDPRVWLEWANEAML